MIFSYKKCEPKYVKFQRIMMGWLAIASLFLREIDLVWLFFIITALGLFSGTAYSLPTLFYKLVQKIFKLDMVRVSSHHIRYYQINSSVDLIDHLLRLIASGASLALYYSEFEVAAWLLMAFLSVFMMLSAYFGFCLSALTYIGLESVRERFYPKSPSLCDLTEDNSERRINENCILAKRCFTPYKRCDSCHIGITKCLGTKFNTLVIIIGLLMSLFLFIENESFVHINILLIMALIFWLGYQINYSTDALAESNNANKMLYQQLAQYTHTLEDEVKRRTAEIEHLATHDMLTELYNRFSFENSLTEALDSLDEKHPSHLAFIDLDKFKFINDTAGHLAGDRLLRNMALMITATVGETGMVARIGGDEFAVLFKDVTQAEALGCCQDICDQAGRYEFVWEDQTFGIGTSIGLATLKSSMQDIKAVLHHADQACYTAKKSGRNQVSLYK